MPNHVTNRIVFSGPIEDVAEIKRLVVVDDKTGPLVRHEDGSVSLDPSAKIFDFNQITPMPPILLRVVSPVRLGPNGRVMMQTDGGLPWSRDTVEATEIEQAELEAIRQQTENTLKSDDISDLMTFPDWYNWSLQHWGTKWNSYNFEPGEDYAKYECSFDTAWSAPNPIFDKLALKFPNVGIDIAWFDEGWMHAGSGSLGHCATTGTSEGFYTEPSDEIYERVYGVPPISDDEFETGYVLTETTADQLRLADNFTNYDVGGSMDNNGCFALTAVFYSDDPGFEGYPSSSDDELYKIRMYRDRIAQRLGIAI